MASTEGKSSCRSYQSYQSGIETYFSKGHSFFAIAINRTKVELKPVHTNEVFKLSTLSIVPKWNWNKREGYVWLRNWSINRTKVELKQYFQRYRFAGYHSINRTKVELKQNKHQCSVQHSAPINRTKVELKLLIFTVDSTPAPLSIVPKWNWNGILFECCVFYRYLSIVPKWNWNVLRAVGVVHLLSINRTKVELKQIIAPLSKLKGMTINRTKVELKHNCIHYPSAWAWTINRTKVELKPITQPATRQSSTIYQSYQSGIETL